MAIMPDPMETVTANRRVTRQQVRAVKCPRCYANAGYPCFRVDHTRRKSNHIERVRLAQSLLSPRITITVPEAGKIARPVIHTHVAPRARLTPEQVRAAVACPNRWCKSPVGCLCVGNASRTSNHRERVTLAEQVTTMT